MNRLQVELMSFPVSGDDNHEKFFSRRFNNEVDQAGLPGQAFRFRTHDVHPQSLKRLLVPKGPREKSRGPFFVRETKQALNTRGDATRVH